MHAELCETQLVHCLMKRMSHVQMIVINYSANLEGRARLRAYLVDVTKLLAK